VQFEVESAGVADGFAIGVAAPQSRRRRIAVGAGQTGSPVATAARL
jgi:hypothetical protein